MNVSTGCGKTNAIGKCIFASRPRKGHSRPELSYQTLRKLPGHTLLAVQLKTGRKHQIRLQLSHRGWPIVGDRKYQSEQSFPAGIALHARQLVVEHPTQKEELKIEAPLPKSLAQVGLAGIGAVVERVMKRSVLRHLNSK